MSRTTAKTTSPNRSSTTTTNTQTTKETAMKTPRSQTNTMTTITIEQVSTLSGAPLQAAYREVLGEEPNAKAPAVAMRKKIVAELKRREAKEATARAAGEAAHEAAVEMIEEAAAAEQPATEQPATAPEIAQETPVGEPAPVIAATPEDAPQSHTEPAIAAKDATDLLLDRARTMEPATRDAFLAATPKKELHAAVERLTGQKTSGRLSPANAVARIKEALKAEKAEAAAESTPDAETEEPAESEPHAEQAATEEPAEGEQPAAANATEPSAPPTAIGKPERDPRLPAVGTILRRVDRHGQVRAECTVEADGFTFAGTKYNSLSGAAMAAAKSLGLTSKTQNGFSFWGLDSAGPRPARTATTKVIDFEAIEGAFKRYLERAQAATEGVRAEDRAKLQEMLAAHSKSLLDLNAAMNQPADATPDSDGAATPDAA